jgi:very-short-patch-repair endonuclease
MADQARLLEPAPKATTRTLRAAVEDTLINAYSKAELLLVLPEEFGLEWAGQTEPSEDDTKRSLIAWYTDGWDIHRLADLGRRICAEPDIPSARLQRLLAEYDSGGGVRGAPKNLIFAANGPKPEMVLRDAVNNDVEIVRHGEHCLVFSDQIPADGLRFSTFVAWWRKHESIPEATPDLEVARSLHKRLHESLDGNPVEEVVLRAYARRYRDDFSVHALIPQVYLHYDPLTWKQHQRLGRAAGDLARQRMDFLILFNHHRRVVIEVDGKQHYADDNGMASTRRYADMVAEDRRLRLAGYEVYRFGGLELGEPGAEDMLSAFFDELSPRVGA